MKQREMFRTRNSYKRPTALDTSSTKKKRLDEDEVPIEDEEDLDDTDADSDYKPGASESDSDEVESKFFSKPSNMKTKLITKEEPSTSKEVVNKSRFKERDLESDSSSDEFEKVPFSLDDLGDFKKFESNTIKTDNSDDGKDSNEEDSDAGVSKSDAKESEYFDFTQIMQWQEVYKSVAGKNESGVDKSSDNSLLVTSKRQDSERKNKEYVRRKCKKFKSSVSEKTSNDLNVMDLLKLGEGNTTSKNEDDEDDYDSEDNYEHEVKEEQKPRDIQVTIELPSLEQRKDRKKCDIDAAIKRRFNLIKKQNQVFAHKVHVLCLIAYGNHLNNVINSQELMALALSLIPAKHCYPPKRCDLHYLEKLVEWYVNKVKIIGHNVGTNRDLHKSLEEQFTNQISYSIKDLVLMFVCMVRALGLTVRLMLNLRPVPLKPPANELCTVSNTANKKSVEKNDKTKKSDKKNTPAKSSGSKAKTNDNEEKAGTSKYFDEVDSTSSTNDKGKARKRSKGTNAKSEYFETVDKQKSAKSNEESGSSPKQRKSRGKVEIDKSVDTKKEVESKRPRRTTRNKKSLSKDSELDVKILDSSSESDEDVFKPQRKKQSSKNVNSRSKEKIDRRVLSSDDENSSRNNTKKKNTVDIWAEVFLEAEEKWISVDLMRGKIHCTELIYCSSAQPVTYILGWENKGHIKDLTRRYVPHWMTVTRKLRADPDWWQETIRPYMPPNDVRNREEDEDLDKQMEDQSLPKSVGDFKNHPLYALRRHLLKFQAIYPPDAPTVGFIRNEPVFSRLCVVELHTRETWIKEAKCVRIGEEPYKIVKARPKYDKLTGTVIKDLPLNLFGYWQVEDYIPPPAVDGKVPRNEYGNVELYKPCMLPAGTVHLQLPGLNRVAKKLNIDCAPAVVGWDFHSGGSHPVLDGFIVCEEFRDKLLDAWNTEIDESAKRAREKIEQRVYTNWRRIIKGLLIREKLKLRYGFEDLPKEPKSKKKHHHPTRRSAKK